MALYLSMDQLAYLAQKAGFEGEGLRNIVAIAWAESGGRVDAVGDGGNSRSIVQIYAPAHPQYDPAKLLSDPEYAFKAAFEISGGGKNFGAWTTWSHATEAGKNANAQQYLDAASKAVTGVTAALAQGATIDTTPKGKPGTATPSSSQAGLTAGTDTRAGTAAEDLPPDATPDQITHYIELHYPQAAPYLANPEIRAILVRPDIDEMDGVEIEALLRGTDYWKTHGPDSRAFDALIGSDGIKAGQVVDRAKNILGGVFARNGVELDDQRLGEVAKQAIRNGWINLEGGVTDAAAIQDFVAYTQRLTGEALSGEAATTADQLSALARQYGITLSRPSLEDWSLKIGEGNASEDSFKAYLTSMAKGIWQNDPDVLRALDSGITPTGFFDAHRQTIAQLLERSPDQVDLFNDPTWAEVTQHYDPTMNGGKGGRRSMTLGEAAQFARDRPEYEETTAFKQTNAGTATKLLDFLGKVG